MDSLETGREKIKKICDVIKSETLEPARIEAQGIIDSAHQKGEDIIKEAQDQAAQINKEAKEKIEREKEIFHHSLAYSCKQAMEELRQKIENQLFNESMAQWLSRSMEDPKLTAELVTALVHAIQKEGISADFSALIPSTIPAEKVNAQLAKEILDQLREKSVSVAGFSGGVQIKMHDRRMILDVSDQAIQEMLEKYIRKDFRDILFAQPQE